MKHKLPQTILAILTGIAFTFFFISLAVVIVVNFRQIYYWDISLLDLEGTYGLTVAQIRANYDTLIDYNSPFSFGLLQFPDLPSSTEALIHFVEVKQLFMKFYLLGILSVLALMILIPIQRRWGSDTLKRTFKISSLTVILLPALVGLAVALNFDTAFVIFHQIFFKNDFWLFDPGTDPIILLLPDTFFLHCAVWIVLLVLFGALSLFLISRCLKTHETTENFL